MSQNAASHSLLGFALTLFSPLIFSRQQDAEQRKDFTKFNLYQTQQQILTTQTQTPMCQPKNKNNNSVSFFMMSKSVSLHFQESNLDLGKTPLAFETRRRLVQSQGSFASFSTESDDGSMTSTTTTTSPRRYRRQRQKSSKDIHKTFLEASF